MITLRELTKSDIPIINTWRNDRVVIDGVTAPFRHIGIEVDEVWFARYLDHRTEQVRCVICLAETGAVVGLASLTNIDHVHRKGEFHILVGVADARNRGVGTAATAQMVRHGLCDLNLHRIYLTVLEDNRAAIRVYEKVGFKQEGLLRDGAYKNGRYRTMLLMGILRSDLPEPPCDHSQSPFM